MHLAEATAVADVHISSLLSVFLNPELNPVWNERLVEQRLVHVDGRRLAFQVYRRARRPMRGPRSDSHPFAVSVRSLPWPVADREFLISCTDNERTSEEVYESWCNSVESDQLPVGEGRVRAHIHGAQWRFQAAGPERTHITFKGSVDPMGPLPKAFIGAAQKIISKSTIIGLLDAQKWLGVPPHERFAHWGGTAASASGRAEQRGGASCHHRKGAAGWCARTRWCPFVRPCAAAAASRGPLTPTPQPTTSPPPSPPPTPLKTFLLGLGIALTAWLARRLSWQGLLRLLVRAQRRKAQRRTPPPAFSFSALDGLDEASLRKVRSCIQMQRHAPRAHAGPSGLKPEAAAPQLPPDLSDVLSDGAGCAVQQMRRCSSHSQAVCRRRA
jgi:hypothetical protein